MCNRRKSGADGHFCGDTQKGKDSSRGRKRGTLKGTSCGEEERFGHNTGSNFPDGTGEVRDGEVLGVSDEDCSGGLGLDNTISGSMVYDGDFSAGGLGVSDGAISDVSGGDFSAGGEGPLFDGKFSVIGANGRDGGIAEISGDTSDGFAYNLKEHKKREEKCEAAANSSAKSSRIIGKIYKPRRMVAAVLAAAMFLFAFPLNSLAQMIKDTNAAEGSLNNGGKSETVSITGKPENRIVAEAADRRSESTKQFLMDDGSYLLVGYPMNVHYRGSDGEWVDYNNTMNTTDIPSGSTTRFRGSNPTALSGSTTPLFCRCPNIPEHLQR